MKKRAFGVFVAGAVLGAFAAGSVLAQSTQLPRRSSLPSLALPAPAAGAKIDRELRRRTGTVQVVVRLADAPLVVANGENALREGGGLDRRRQQAYVADLAARQSAVLAQLRGLGAREIARLRLALNAVILEVDASQLDAIASVPTVTAVNPVRRYQTMLDETVPYVGAAAAHSDGVTGKGVVIAVLDSGIDYTHRNLGGEGTLEAYAAAYGTSTSDPRNTTLDGLFPTTKVIGGYDFVGEAWPNGPVAPDPDPIDFEGHGTSVADIAAGRENDGLHRGMAPDAKLLAVKVCSAISSSCEGTALLRGMEFALDPNGDGAIEDAADVINLSLGSPYGQPEDDLSAAAANAVRAGVVVVASAGNSADRPFIVGSPSSAPEVISVAQTQVPGALAFPLTVTGISSSTIANTATVDWAPIGNGFSGPVAYVGQACPGQALAPATSLAGRVALIDRGACSVSLKTDVAAKAGAIGVIIANNAPGDPPTFSFGGGDSFVPTVVISQDDGARIKDALGATGVAAGVAATISASNSIALARSMVASSSRGPSVGASAIKPEIGAPGASIAAVAGTGTGEAAFGGTSGAAPVVSGAAALLLEKHPNRSPREIRALLAGTGETNIRTNPATLGETLAPITRIGGGELRVAAALDAETAAWDTRTGAASLSFGYRPVAQSQVLSREVRIRNYSRFPRLYRITPTFRYEDDRLSRAVRVEAPQWVAVGPRGTETFEVRLVVDASRLPVWTLDGGLGGGDGPTLQGVEFDGYLQIRDALDTIRLAWHVLPDRSADVAARASLVRLRNGAGSLELRNAGSVLEGGVDLFALTGTSPRVPRAQLPGEGDNFSVNDLRAVGVRGFTAQTPTGPLPVVQFAINTYTRRTHPAYPGGFDVYVDSNDDGTDDYVVYNGELGNFATDGRTAVFVFDLRTGIATPYSFADADFNSRNLIMTVPAAAIGVNLGARIRYSVLAFDNYFTGNLTDAIEDMRITLGTPRFAVTGGSGFVASALGDFAVPPRGRTTLDVAAVPGGATASPSQSGLLLMYRDASTPNEAEAIRVR